MKARRLDTFADLETTMVDADCQPMGSGRARGLHLSDLIQFVKKRRGEKVGAIEGDTPGLRMFLGFVWEFAIELAFKALMRCRAGVMKQPKVELDGIHMSPDAVLFEGAEAILEEYKSTSKSSNGLLRSNRSKAPMEMNEALSLNFWGWVEAQIPAYIYALNQQWGLQIRKCRLYVLFIRGDYQGPAMQVVPIELEYEEWELERTWQMMLGLKKEFLEEVSE